MAYPTDSIDLNRGSLLPPELSREVWAGAAAQSAIMQLAQRIELPGAGLSIPVITGDPIADFVAETAEKPVSASTIEPKTMTPYKIAVIELFSNEFRRDLGALYDELVRRLPSAIAKKFDETVFTGTAPGTGFDTFANVTDISINPSGSATVYDQLVSMYEAIASANGELTGWALSSKAIAKLMGAKDGNGYPIFTTPAGGNLTQILGAPVVKAQGAYKAGAPDVIGIAGDWSAARYGIVDGIKVEFSDQATVNDGSNQINLWQRNMFAVRVEAEVGFAVRDDDLFVAITGDDSESS